MQASDLRSLNVHHRCIWHECNNCYWYRVTSCLIYFSRITGIKMQKSKELSTRVAQIVTAAHTDTYNLACTDLLMNSGHKPITRSVWPTLLDKFSSTKKCVKWHFSSHLSPWAACLTLSAAVLEDYFQEIPFWALTESGLSLVIIIINPFTTDPLKALHFAILV